MKWKSMSILACTLSLIAFVGCNSEEKVHDVSGTVLYGGKPVPKGAIHFDPDPSKGGSGQSGFANIQDGKFDTAEKGKGIRGGAYLVRINAFDGQTAGESPWGQPLCPEHLEPRELKPEKQVVEFNIPSKKK